MGRIQVTLAAIAVIAIVSLAMNIAILVRSGDGSTGASPGQFAIEQASDESLGAQVGEARERRLERRLEKQKEEKEEKKKGLR